MRSRSTRKHPAHPELTRREHDCLMFIDRFVTKHYYMPSVHEVKHGMGYKSPHSPHLLMQGLKRKGYLTTGAWGNRQSYSFNRAKHQPPMERVLARAKEAEAILKFIAETGYRLVNWDETMIDIRCHLAKYRVKLETGAKP